MEFSRIQSLDSILTVLDLDISILVLIQYNYHIVYFVGKIIRNPLIIEAITAAC